MSSQPYWKVAMRMWREIQEYLEIFEGSTIATAEWSKSIGDGNRVRGGSDEERS